MKWHRVFVGCWHGFHEGQNNPCLILERNEFGRRLWTVEIVGRGRVTDGRFDCFRLADAKEVAVEALAHIGNETSHDDELLHRLVRR
jgi:hypothetical protein